MAEAVMVKGVAVVAYVNGMAVDSEGREVKGAPPESPVTDPSLQPHSMAALNTEERSAAILANALATALNGVGTIGSSNGSSSRSKSGE
jgi:hypothetical protein